MSCQSLQACSYYTNRAVSIANSSVTKLAPELELGARHHIRAGGQHGGRLFGSGDEPGAPYGNMCPLPNGRHHFRDGNAWCNRDRVGCRLADTVEPGFETGGVERLY